MVKKKITKFYYCNRLLTCSCVTIAYSVCVNSGGVVKTSDVCLDCHTVIDRDVDLNRLLHWCLEKKLQDVECLFLSFFCRCSYSQRLVADRIRERMLHTVLRQALYLDSISSLGRQTVEWKTSRLMYCSRSFSSAGADACSLWRGRAKRNGQVVLRVLSTYFKDMCDHIILWKGVEALQPFVLKPQRVYVGLQPLLLSSASPPYPSHFMCSRIQRVSLPVNLRCDKACNLIVALFSLCSRQFTPLCQRTVFHGRTIPPDPPGRPKKD